MSTDTILECSRKKIVSYDLQTKTKHILTQGTENDFGFYGVIYYDTVLYSCAQIIERQDPKHFQYTLYRYDPISKTVINNNEKWYIYTKKYLTNKKPKPYYMPSFILNDTSLYCSFAGQVFDLNTEERAYLSPNSFLTYFLGDDQIYVGINNPGEYQANRHIIVYQIESRQKVMISSNNHHDEEKHLSFKKHIISWIASNYHSRLYIRSSPDVTISAEKNRVGLRQNSNTTFSISFHSNLGYATTAGLSYSFPDNPNGLTCSFNPTTIQLDGINDTKITVTTYSSASVPKGIYRLELAVHGNTFLLPHKVNIMVDVADFTIRSEIISDFCYVDVSKTFKIFIKNLLAKEQAYDIEIIPDYIEDGGTLSPDYMEYSVNSNSLTVPPSEEYYVEFTILMKASIYDFGYYFHFTFIVTNTADKSKLNQEITLILFPSFWIQSNRDLISGVAGSIATYNFTVCASPFYSGTVTLDLDSFTKDNFPAFSFKPKIFTLQPNEKKAVSLEFEIKDLVQQYEYLLKITMHDNVKENNYYMFEFELEPTFFVSIENPIGDSVTINTTHQWRISISSLLSSKRIIKIMHDPIFDHDEDYKYEFSTTELTFQGKDTQQVILSISSPSIGSHFFSLLTLDNSTLESSKDDIIFEVIEP
ncbi:hypothetical protein LLG10_06060 [bacterium]|nr:hypothetical protein [bacterium]